MKVLFYLGHPAHFHLFRRVMLNLEANGHSVAVAIKRKDVLEELLRRDGRGYHLLQTERGSSKLAMGWALLKRDLRLVPLVRAFRPNVMVGTSAEIAHVGRLMDITSVVVNEDDYDVVPLFGRMAYPFATAILAPRVCRMGGWDAKTVRHDSYHELAYLHPHNFAPDPQILAPLGMHGGRYFVLRLAQLTAHHDAGIRGIDLVLARRLIGMLEPHGRVFITSERALEAELEPYRIAVDPLQMHHVLSFAHLYIGDSQTMAAEAAVLGTPALRFNDFVGRISYLEELEHRFGLTYGVPASSPSALLDRIASLLAHDDLKREWHCRRDRMLTERIDLAAFMTTFIEECRGNGRTTGRPSE